MEGQLKISITDSDGKEIGYFYIPKDASLEYLKKNVPSLIRGAQIIAESRPEKEAKRQDGK